MSRRLDVCVIDDDPLVREALALVLGDGNCNVMTAASWREAEAACRSATFDVIISDLQLPHLPDADIVRRLRALCPNTPIIAMSGWSDHCAEALARSFGAAFFLPKPSRMQKVFEAIARLTGKSAALLEPL